MVDSVSLIMRLNRVERMLSNNPQERLRLRLLMRKGEILKECTHNNIELALEEGVYREVSQEVTDK